MDEIWKELEKNSVKEPENFDITKYLEDEESEPFEFGKDKDKNKKPMKKK